jgi:enoyl-CoA hydratase
VIAAVHGFCLGGGIGMVGSSDIILASEDATFGMPEIDRGAMGAASHLLRMFPLQKVRKMFFTAEPISAAEAYRLGALERSSRRTSFCRARARSRNRSPRKSPKAVRLAKESLNGIEPVDVKKTYRYEQGFTLELYTSPDSQEARDAFVEKRAAQFEGAKPKTK